MGRISFYYDELRDGHAGLQTLLYHFFQDKVYLEKNDTAPIQTVVGIFNKIDSLLRKELENCEDFATAGNMEFVIINEDLIREQNEKLKIKTA